MSEFILLIGSLAIGGILAAFLLVTVWRTYQSLRQFGRWLSAKLAPKSDVAEADGPPRQTKPLKGRFHNG